jgi:hypothetical protein
LAGKDAIADQPGIQIDRSLVIAELVETACDIIGKVDDGSPVAGSFLADDIQRPAEIIAGLEVVAAFVIEGPQRVVEPVFFAEAGEPQRELISLV